MMAIDNVKYGKDVLKKMRTYMEEVRYHLELAENMMEKLDDVFADMTPREDDELTTHDVTNEALALVNGMAKAFKGGLQ